MSLKEGFSEYTFLETCSMSVVLLNWASNLHVKEFVEFEI